MYVIKRKQSMWLCTTTIEAFQNQNVQLRLQNKDKDFKTFEQRLDAGEHIDAGVISIYKCSDTITQCKDCIKCKDCSIHEKVRETAQVHAEWAKWVEYNDGYLI